MTAISEAIKEMSKTNDEKYCIVCTVDSVDLTDNTCYCLPLDESKADLMKVRLQADNKTGFLIIPKQGSYVIVSMLTNEAGYISMFSEVESIYLNGDDYNGIIKVDDWLQSYNTQITTLKAAILAALTSVDASIVALGGASVSGPAFQVATASITNIQASAITNNTVKHGSGI